MILSSGERKTEKKARGRREKKSISSSLLKCGDEGGRDAGSRREGRRDG